MWGKLTERNSRVRTKMISDPRELYRFLVMPGIEVMNLLFSSDDVVWASWRFIAEEKIPCLRHTKEFLGAFVASAARMHLYSYLDHLQENALYCDTDSVFYIQREDEPMLIECGDKLDDMTDDLKPGECTSEFVSAGPKNYAYRICERGGKEKTACKVRGITLNYSASRCVNFDVIKDMILNGRPDDTVTAHTDKKIKRKKRGAGVSVVTEPEDKIYRISFLKRQRLSDNTSVPFGYKYEGA
jgi:hypothetical protein